MEREKFDVRIAASEVEVAVRHREARKRADGERDGRLLSVRGRLAELDSWVDEHTPPLVPVRWGTWNGPFDAPTGLLRVGKVCRATPAGPVTCAAWVPFPAYRNLVVEYGPGSEDEAVPVFQGLLLRVLASLPRAKVRVTFVDPGGLGSTFSAFGGLPQEMVGQRVLVKQADVVAHLDDLADHAESVNREVLRGQFESYDAAWEGAGGAIAAPYRVLAIAGLSEDVFHSGAFERLAAVWREGPRLGIYTVLLVSAAEGTRLWSRLGSSAADGMLIFRCTAAGTTMSREYGAGGSLGLELSAEPELVHLVVSRLVSARAEGEERAREEKGRALRFSGWHRALLSPVQELPRNSTCRGIQIPIGLRGEDHAEQDLILRGDTNFCALVGGMSGSGKSWLFHVIITGGMLRYPPSELQMYLVDFKEGVEFRPYAGVTSGHVKVVALHADREFCLSVLRKRRDEEVPRGGVPQGLCRIRETSMT